MAPGVLNCVDNILLTSVLSLDKFNEENTFPARSRHVAGGHLASVIGATKLSKTPFFKFFLFSPQIGCHVISDHTLYESSEI